MRAFCLRAVVLAALALSALAGSAYADRADAATTPAQEAPSGEAAEGGGVTGQGGETEQQGAGSGGQGSEEAPESGGAVGGEETKETPPVGEEPKETPPVTEEHQETTPIEEHTESTPAATVPGESAESTGAGQGEEAGKAAHTGAGLEEEPRLSAGADSGIAQAGLAHEAAGETAVALLGAPTSPPTVGGPEAQASVTSELAVAGTRAAMTAAQRAGEMSCELADLGGRTTDNCTVGWLGAKRLLTTSVTLEPVASSLAVAAAGLPGGGGRGGSAGGNSPVSPTPGPAPGGASGAAVGGGGPGGGALSIFLTLAGLLLLGGPRAMRRLRLSHRPWLTACFVLIPERPG